MNDDMQKRLLSFVSRETILKYEVYFEELVRWNKSTRLIQEKTLNEFWNRHILDSLQIMPYLGKYSKIIDMGTGAGFPGMVLAISGVKNITLCESMLRKCVFLNEVKRLTNTEVEVLNLRVENIIDCSYDLILSRAMTELINLIESTLIVSRETKARMLIHKGKNYEQEIEKALQTYDFVWEKYSSITDSQGVILDIKNIKKK